MKCLRDLLSLEEEGMYVEMAMRICMSSDEDILNEGAKLLAL